LGERKNAIINYEVLPKGAPYPLTAHTQYFSDQYVMKNIYWSIMQGELPPDKGRPPQGIFKFGRVFGWGGSLAVLLATSILAYAFLEHIVTVPTFYVIVFAILLFYSFQRIWFRKMHKNYNN
jgi:hypothetical protein